MPGNNPGVRRIWRRFALPAAAGVLTILVFLPSLRGELVWEDRLNLIENTGWMGFSPGWWLTSFVAGDYKPAVWTSYALDYFLWGRFAPFGFHIPNLLLHGLNAALLALLARRLAGGGRFWPLAAALLFSLHPLRVEAVSWVTSRKEVLFACFYLVSVWAYLKIPGDPRRSRLWYGLSVAAAFLSFLSKPMSVSLPAVLLLLDWYLRRPVPAVRLIREKIPYLLGAIAVSAAAFYGQSSAGALALVSRLPAESRLFLAARGAVFYLEKTVWPFGLFPIYPIIGVEPPPWGRMIGYSAVLLAVTALAICRRRRGDALPLFCWGWYLLTWLPVSGFFQTGLTAWADRFSYLPAVSFSLLAAGVGSRYLQGRSGRLAAAGTILVLGVLTFRQQGFWQDEVAMWERFGDSGAPAVHLNLANSLSRRGRLKEAVGGYRRSLELRPLQPAAHHNLGLVLVDLGESGEAEEHFLQAVELEPCRAEYRVNLANVLAGRGEWEAAEDQYRAALRIAPDSVSARYNRAYTLQVSGRQGEAEEEYRRVISLDPGHFSARYNLALLLLERGEGVGARLQLEEAARIRPESEPVRRLLDGFED